MFGVLHTAVLKDFSKERPTSTSGWQCRHQRLGESNPMRVVSSGDVLVSCQPWPRDTPLQLGELMWGPGLWTTQGSHICSAQLMPRPCFLWAPGLSPHISLSQRPSKGPHERAGILACMLGLICSPWVNVQSLPRGSWASKTTYWIQQAVSLDLIQPQQNAGDHFWVRNMPFVCGHFSNQKFVGGNMKQLGVYLLPKVLLQSNTAAVWSGGSLQRLYLYNLLFSGSHKTRSILHMAFPWGCSRPC